MLKLVRTKNKWRLVGAVKGKVVTEGKASKKDSKAVFLEERVPTRVTKMGRGQMLVEPEKPLEPGEYALVLRPIADSKKPSKTALPDSSEGEKSMSGAVWDFAVGLKSTVRDTRAGDWR